MMKTCPTCGGKMVFDVTSFFHYARGRTYLVENVPTDFCPECGERLFHAKVMKSLDAHLTGEYAVKDVLSIEVVEMPDMPDYGKDDKRKSKRLEITLD